MTSGAREDAFLSRIISTVSSTLELEEVLEAVVELLSDASAVHACFVYLLDPDDDERLVLEAASAPYAHLAGRIELRRGESLAWWAAERREPAFIRDRANDDPRTTFVPELEEERFQSLLTVPIVGRSDDLVGAVTVHTEAPREFSGEEVDFLVTAASLVAGAIENARLYSEMRERVRELEQLTALSEAVASADTFEQLLPAAVDGARALLGASACHLYLIEPGGDELVLRRSSPAGSPAAGRLGLAELGPQLGPRMRRGRVSAPLVADRELVGLVVAEGTRRTELARGLAGQLAVGVRKVRLIERLTERNLVADFLDELASGRPVADLDGRAARLGCDLGEPHVALVAEPCGADGERALRAALPGALLHLSDQALRGLVRLPRGGLDALTAMLGSATAELASPVPIGLSSPSASVQTYVGAFEEARHARAGTIVLGRTPPIAGYDELGAYKYLLRIGMEAGERDATVQAVGRLARYDRDRQTQLLATLEEFLHRQGSISATSDALYVHPNTLRQRRRRIAEVADLDLRRDDWLELEIAVKLVRLGALDTRER